MAIIGLGLAGCALSFDALRQMATAIHVRHYLTALFPIVIDGFIAYGVRALLVLRQAPLPARLYAWTLFIAATLASVWANGLHAVDLNQPGTVALHLGDTTVAILSAIAPLALAGATHLHILITRHGNASAPSAESESKSGTETHRGIRAVRNRCVTALRRFRTTPSAPVSTPLAAASAAPEEPPALGAGLAVDDDPDDSAKDAEPVVASGGRPALASIDRLAEVITAAHPDGSGLTRDSARKAVNDAGLGAGTERLSQALALARQRPLAGSHPAD